MTQTDTFVLSEDVLVFPATDLEADERARSGADADDYIVTRPHARQGSTVVDREGAALIESFRTPRTIVDAVIDFSRVRERDPHRVLEEAFPLIDRLVTANLLAPNGSDHARRIEPTLATGDAFGAWTVEQAVHVLADTEVYRARGATGALAALKFARPGHEAALRMMMVHEAAILEHVAGTAAPRLIEAGERDGRPFLLLEWCDGAPATAVARRLQREPGLAGAERLLELCVAVLEAYAGLHGRGVVQGDIHPNNLLVGEDGTVRVIDFGRARLLAAAGPLGSPDRGGAAFYFDPQYAKAAIDERPPPPADPASEQYSIAVLLR
jgi:eukaryotic-like serine/threonine-protein kinase